MKDYYRVLQVDPEAEPDVIKAAYDRLAIKYHPYVDGTEESAQRLKEVKEAYSVLSHAKTKAAYDIERAAIEVTDADDFDGVEDPEETAGANRVAGLIDPHEPVDLIARFEETRPGLVGTIVTLIRAVAPTAVCLSVFLYLFQAERTFIIIALIAVAGIFLCGLHDARLYGSYNGMFPFGSRSMVFCGARFEDFEGIPCTEDNGLPYVDHVVFGQDRKVEEACSAMRQVIDNARHGIRTIIWTRLWSSRSLRSAEERLWEDMAEAGCTIVIGVAIWLGLPRGTHHWGSDAAWLSWIVLTIVAIIFPIVWSSRRSYVEGVRRGYIRGYADGYVCPRNKKDRV